MIQKDLSFENFYVALRSHSGLPTSENLELPAVEAGEKMVNGHCHLPIFIGH